MLIQKITLTNLLSFRQSELELQPLNVLIGPNGSGKSNLLEAISLLQAAPRDLPAAVRRGGGVSEWLWKGEESTAQATVEAVLDNPQGATSLRYLLTFAERGQAFDIVEERLETAEPLGRHDRPYLFFEVQNGQGVLNVKPAGSSGRTPQRRRLEPDSLTPGQSVLRERRDPEQYPELTDLARRFDAIRLYREWAFGYDTAPRRPQPADGPSAFLEEEASNLALVLNRLERGPSIARIEAALKNFYEPFDRFSVQVEGGTAQLFLREKGLTSLVPATRISDGTLRFLCLLSVLCHPQPPPLIGLEEPELGLHPEAIPLVAELLQEASNRTQLIVTTHSDALVDELSSGPEAVVVVARDFDGGTVFRRLEPDGMAIWLENYRLGELWRKGELGGTRW